MNLEEELRNALRRVEPPEGFAGRVLARAAREPEPRPWWAGWRPALAWAAALAACALIFAGLQYQHRRLERARGEEAKREVMLALRIAGRKLHMAQHKVQQIDGFREKKL